jgi:hypothetical protein
MLKRGDGTRRLPVEGFGGSEEDDHHASPQSW